MSASENRGQLIDLSHTIEEGTSTYPGLPAPQISEFMSREESRSHYMAGTEFQIGRIELVGNTGTYVDSPFHRFAHGKDLSELPLSSIANLEGLVVRAPNERSISNERFRGIAVCGRAVLVDTGWSKHWGSDRYFSGHPFLTAHAAQYLKDSGAALVGIDSLNIDSTDDGRRPVHTILLGANVPIVEHLCNLSLLPDSGFRFFAVPVKVKSFSSFPVRAFALLGSKS